MMKKVRTLIFFTRCRIVLEVTKILLGLVKRFYILISVRVTWVHAFVQTHRIIRVRFVHFTLRTFYLKKFCRQT